MASFRKTIYIDWFIMDPKLVKDAKEKPNTAKKTIAPKEPNIM